MKDLLDAQVSLFPIFVNMADKRQEIVQELLKCNEKVMRVSFERERKLMNSLSLEELQKLELYYGKLNFLVGHIQ